MWLPWSRASRHLLRKWQLNSNDIQRNATMSVCLAHLNPSYSAESLEMAVDWDVVLYPDIRVLSRHGNSSYILYQTKFVYTIQDLISAINTFNLDKEKEKLDTKEKSNSTSPPTEEDRQSVSGNKTKSALASTYIQHPHFEKMGKLQFISEEQENADDRLIRNFVNMFELHDKRTALWLTRLRLFVESLMADFVSDRRVFLGSLSSAVAGYAAWRILS